MYFVSRNTAKLYYIVEELSRGKFYKDIGQVLKPFILVAGFWIQIVSGALITNFTIANQLYLYEGDSTIDFTILPAQAVKILCCAFGKATALCLKYTNWIRLP